MAGVSFRVRETPVVCLNDGKMAVDISTNLLDTESLM
jgi:hypothetical protein